MSVRVFLARSMDDTYPRRCTSSHGCIFAALSFQDEKLALKHFKKAAEKGFAEAQFNLGAMYFGQSALRLARMQCSQPS